MKKLYGILMILIAGLLFASCDVMSALIIDSSGAAADSAQSASSSNSGTSTGMVYIPENSERGILSLSFNANNNPSSRTAVGANGEQIHSGGLRNFFQLIAVDLSAPKQVWDFDQANADSGTITLNMLVKNGKRYVILILSGHLNPGETRPTLLASGYTSMTTAPDVQVIIPMTPLVVDAEFLDDSGAGAPFSKAAPPVAELDPANNWTVYYTIGSDEEKGGIARGDGLSPLRFVYAAVNNKGSNEWWGGDGSWGYISDSSAADPHVSFIKFTNTKTNALTNTGSISRGWENNTTAPCASLALPAITDGDTGSVYFNIGYHPFGFDYTAWANNYPYFQHPLQSKPIDNTGIPLWIIRNGLNDNLQDASTDFGKDSTAADSGKNSNGALNVLGEA
jgi:hypothetical protein